MKRLFLPALVCLLCSCGRGYYYDEAARLELQGMPLKAAEYYDLFAARDPGDPRAPAALFRAADIYARKFGLCSRAAPVLERLLKNYPEYASRRAAMKTLLVCPDYLPFDRPFSWTYGDSDTGGLNARQVSRVTDLSPFRGASVTRTYAGRKLVATQKRKFELRGLDIVEAGKGRDALLLRYPVEQGLSWVSVIDGRRLRFTVEAVGLKVKVRAGEFENCIKVKQAQDGAPSWVYEYYAPWVGKVLTSVAGKKFESRVTELIKYEKTER
ncbi:MAG TPA: tetratricopeptide repeat protein [Elusimicrobiales bacterium]|nr:tetratricopeptide repeat protein [Elusimicrobiales bacterium]